MEMTTPRKRAAGFDERRLGVAGLIDDVGDEQRAAQEVDKLGAGQQLSENGVDRAAARAGQHGFDEQRLR